MAHNRNIQLRGFPIIGFLSASDQSLLDREFRIEHPENVQRLVNELPALDGPPDIVAWYDIKNSGRRRVYCSICKGHHHFKGLVVALPHGEHALVGGSVCGKRHFGVNWALVEREFNREVDRQQDLARLIRIRLISPAVLGFVDAIESSGAVGAIDGYVDGLRRKFGALSQAIAKAARADGKLEVPEDYRDREAEEERARQLWPGLVAEVEGNSVNRRLAREELDRLIEQTCKVVRTRPRLVGQLPGLGLFTNRRAADLIGVPSDEIRALLAIICGDLSGTSLAGRSLGSLLKRLTDAVTSLELGLQLVEHLWDFCSATSLALLVKWGNQMPGVEARLKLDGTSLTDRVTAVRLDVPSAFRTPSIIELEPFWSAQRDTKNAFGEGQSFGGDLNQSVSPQSP